MYMYVCLPAYLSICCPCVCVLIYIHISMYLWSICLYLHLWSYKRDVMSWDSGINRPLAKNNHSSISISPNMLAAT